jgi:DNA-binding response OmpR family regulator
MSYARHILLVDDDRTMRSPLPVALEAAGGFRVRVAEDVATALTAAQSKAERFDAIVLDLAFPAEGAALCAQLRRRGVRVPILMLAASTGEEDVVGGLEAGANDYVAKPFRHAELVARLRAQMRAFETSEDAVLVIGPYHFRPGLRTLTDPADNRRVRLTEKEAAVLKYLYRSAGVPVGRQQLLREVWGYASGASTHTVETHIYRLRRKIEPDPGAARILVNIDGGYRLASAREWDAGLPLRRERAMPREDSSRAMSALAAAE